MKRKSLILLSTTLIAMSVLSACGSKSEDAKSSSSPSPTTAAAVTTEKPAKNVSLKYYNWDNDADAIATKKLIETFESKYPTIKVESISLVPGNSLEALKKLDVTIASGEQVDIFKVPNIEELSARAAQGVLAPLDDLYAKENVKPEEEYYINPKYKGKYYGIITDSTPWLVALNADALKEANLPIPELGWTWDEFRDYAKKLTKGEGNDKQYGTYFHSWGDYANPIAYTDKVNPYLTADFKSNFMDPSFTYFFNLRRAMEKEDKSTKPFADVIGAKLSYRTEFLTGKAAMLLTGNFMLTSMNELDKYPHTFKTVFAPIPRSSKDAEIGLTNIGGTYGAISNSSKNKDEAYTFLRYISMETEARTQLSGWKKVDSNALIEKLYGNNKTLIDIPTLTSSLYDKRLKTSVDTEISVAYAAQLKKIMEDGFSKFILDNGTVEDTQKWMMEQADLIIKQNTK
ncbi:extracellular solute-binding protein [Paenibacillus psychroresistens]|uniref:Extracellular solute-binding protein n=1 Tax=Paenibacillus psychroresistens TaxID=1778678 RepID=A0A6B8RF44_9BACL|nr:extracellular solute-binding protein [Paenibacillus psychroresistens]QGQ95111.1 extracellular solute-binding protein [Paenibacillus psychroresistens]